MSKLVIALLLVAATLSIVLLLNLILLDKAEAKSRNKTTVTENWNGGLSIQSRDRYIYVAPFGEERRDGAAKRQHCSTTGKTTTCGWW
jgi:hypothetical protein